MKILKETALTYDDVLLVPQYSNVDSRRKLSTQTKLTKEITLQIPIVSANMDVVTESEMAIAMAREGGIGIIHRFLSIDEQARQIQKVKKAESFIVENPISMMELEHDEAGGILVRLRELSHGFEAPADSCASYRSLYDRLSTLEKDLHIHIHKENNVLFPRTLQLEAQLQTA